MSMTKKHFELIAEAIRVERPAMTHDDHVNWPTPNWRDNKVLDKVASNLAAQFKMINPRFDKERFIKATKADKEATNERL